MLHHFLEQCRASPNRVVLVDRVRGAPRQLTSAELLAEVLAAGDLLRARGVKRGDRILVLTRNSIEWVVLDLAAQLVGAIPAALAPTSSSAHIRAFISIIEPAQIFAEDVPPLPAAEMAAPVTTVSALREELRARQGRGEELLASYRFDLEATLYLASTSGTTGGYKACMIRYRNALASVDGFARNLPMGASDKNLCFLPLSQTRINDLYLFLCTGGQVCFANPFAELVQQLRQYRPTFVASPPEFFQTIRNIHRLHGGPLKEYLGGATKLFTGTTPVSTELLAHFAEFGAPLYEVYGMTECCSYATWNHAGAHRPGTVGRPHEDMRLSFEEDGEIVIEGPSVFAGYWNNPEATAQALSGGALHTGDVGELDADGFVVLKGRKKEVICLSTGKKFFPNALEAHFSTLPFVKRVVIVGNTLRRPVALVVLRNDGPADQASFRAALEEHNQRYSYDDHITDAVFLPADFSVEAGELTPTNKPVRDRIEAAHWGKVRQIVDAAIGQ